MQRSYVVRIDADLALAEELEAVGLPEIEALVAWHARASDCQRFESYHGTEAEAEAAAGRLRALMAAHAGGRPWTCAIEPVEPVDWAESWKVHFRVERVSPRLVVKPTWETFEAQAGDCVITLDPGMSFGTGNHFTTRSCLAMLDLYADTFRGGAVLDVGCGSGILGIAACKLGAVGLVALDHDPQALAIAVENARGNGVDAAGCRWLQLDLLTDPLPGPFELVVANLFADVLVEGAAALAGALRPGAGARLIVAGVLCEQFPEVRAAFEALSLHLLNVLADGEWITAAFGWGESVGGG